MKILATIVFIVFNRPNHTKRVLDSLKSNKLAKESVLHIFADGSRGTKDDESVGKVREIIRKADGFQEIIVHESPVNLGCSNSVLSAIDHVLSLSERCIIVEDDILVAPNFLEYMNEGLDYYQDNNLVFSIGAYRSAFKMPSTYKDDVYLLKRSCAWGWGTWRRAWKSISVDPVEIKREMLDLTIRKAFAEHGEDWLRTYDDDPEIWDLRVSYGIWKAGMGTVMPVNSYTHNIGRDGSGVHYHGEAMKTQKTYQFPTTLPKFIPLTVVDEDVRKAFKKFSHKSWWRIGATTLAKKLGIYSILLRNWERLGIS